MLELKDEKIDRNLYGEFPKPQKGDELVLNDINYK